MCDGRGRFSKNDPGDPDVIAELSSRTLTSYENDLRIVGDANGDDVFKQLDVVKVLQAGRHGTGQPATWEEGDWNADAVFGQLDTITVLNEGWYNLGPPYASHRDQMSGQNEAMAYSTPEPNLSALFVAIPWLIVAFHRTRR